MKFRIKLTDLTNIRQFAQLLFTFSRWAKRFVFRITEDKMFFIVSERDSLDNRASAACEIPKDTLFDEFAMEGVTPEDNEIYLEISSAMITTCLASLKGPVISTKIKLTKKVVPCLTFEVESQSVHSNIMCVHDCPVTIITRKNWADYIEPDIPHFDISLGFSDIVGILHSLDRLKVLGPRLCMVASKDENTGKLSLTVDSPSINCSVQFKDLRVYEVDDENASSSPVSMSNIEHPTDNITVEVDMKHIQFVMPSEHQKPSKFIISILKERMVHLLFIYGDISLQYCLPGLM